MPVNNFEFEKADGIISSIKGQSVGRDPISAAGIFNFVSIAQKGFGYEPEEEDMVKIIKEVSFEDDILLTDTKYDDVLSMIEQGYIIALWDANGYLVSDNKNPGLYMMGCLSTDLKEILFISAFAGDPIVRRASTDADGYIYFYLD